IASKKLWWTDGNLRPSKRRKRLSSRGRVRRRRGLGRGHGTEDVNGVRPAERRAPGQQRQELLAGLVQLGLEHEGVLGRDQEVAEPTGAAMNGEQAVAHAQSVEPFLAPNTGLGGNVLNVVEADPAHRQAQPGHLQMPGGDMVVDPGRGPQQQHDKQQTAANRDRNFDFSCIHFLCPRHKQSKGTRWPKPSDSQAGHRGPISMEAKTMPSASILLHATRFAPSADDSARASNRRPFLPGRISRQWNGGRHLVPGAQGLAAAGMKIFCPIRNRFQFTPGLASIICFIVTLMPCLASWPTMPSSVSPCWIEYSSPFSGPP